MVCTSVGGTNVKLLCRVVILLPEKTLDKGPLLETLSFWLFFLK